MITVPIVTIRPSGRRSTWRDCHHDPMVHANVWKVNPIPTAAIESPRTSVSISDTNESAAANVTEDRNAAAAAAGGPGRARKVPGGVRARSPRHASTAPAAPITSVTGDGKVSDANSAMPPIASSSDRRTGIDASRSWSITRSAGRISSRQIARTGSGAANAQRHPTVETSSAPTPGPRSPGRIQVVASSARIRARWASGICFATTPIDSA